MSREIPTSYYAYPTCPVCLARAPIVSVISPPTDSVCPQCKNILSWDLLIGGSPVLNTIQYPVGVKVKEPRIPYSSGSFE